MNVEIAANEWCEGCSFLKIKEVVLYEGTRSREVIRVCEHMKICENAVRMYKKRQINKEENQNERN